MPAAEAVRPVSPSAYVLGWLWAMLVNAACIASSRLSGAGLGTALLQQVYDAGHFLFLAALSVGLVLLWNAGERRVPWPAQRREWWLSGARFLALFLAAWALSSFTFDDVPGFITRQRLRPHRTWFVLITTGSALALCAAAGLGCLLSRSRLRWLALPAAACALVLNHSFLIYEYAGPHLFVTLASVLLVGEALRELATQRLPQRYAKHACVALSALGALSVVIAPPPAVDLLLHRSPGTVLQPFLVASRPNHFETSTSDNPHIKRVWLKPRVELPERAPGRPLLPPEELIVILLTVDGLRPDLIHDEQYAHTLPALHAMRQRSLVFTQARSTSPLTRYTIPSMFTGLYAGQLKQTKVKVENSKQRTSYVNAPHLALPGDAIRSVQVYSNSSVGEAQARGFNHNIAVERNVGDGVLEVVREHESGPLFVYAHFMESHSPYAHGADAHLPLFERYVRGVQLVDEQLQRLREYLQQSGKRRRTILILAADHGEAFGEHGFNYHSKTLYEEMVRIAFMIEAPRIKPRKVSTPVSTIDLVPTVLDLFAMPAPGYLMGESLADFLRGRNKVFSRPIGLQSATGLVGLVFPDGHKLIYDRKRRLGEMYNLKTDPEERVNLFDAADEGGHLAALVQFFSAHRPLTP